MNPKHVEEWMKKSYDLTAQQYRRNDEIDATGVDHGRLCKKLADICCSFAGPISALDVGCGTGRYFHCLRNVERLVGIDVSEQMLALARTPVKQNEVSVKSIELRAGNAYTIDFPAQSFDLIFSFGVFGNGCPPEVEIYRRFFRWMKPGGQLFFDTFDNSYLPFLLKMKIKARETIYSNLPPSWQSRWDKRTGWLPFYAVSRKELERRLRKSGFEQVRAVSEDSHLTLGAGRKLECIATKPLNHADS